MLTGLNREPHDAYVDCCVLTSSMLRQYLQRLGPSENKRVVLKRVHPAAGDVIYPPVGNRETRAWFDFQIDQGFAPLFCPVPAQRRDRTRRQIVMGKTFRDIAATFHGRRLFRLVNDTLGEL